jgi:hypothetical protein
MGCAHTAFYRDQELKQETGFRFYTARPYLLVAHTGAADKPTEVSIVFLPDTTNPQYAVHKPGWGSSELTINLANGMATSVGAKADSKGPETLTAVSGLMSSAASLVTALEAARRREAQALGVPPPEPKPGDFALYEIQQDEGGTRLIPVTRK